MINAENIVEDEFNLRDYGLNLGLLRHQGV